MSQFMVISIDVKMLKNRKTCVVLSLTIMSLILAMILIIAIILATQSQAARGPVIPFDYSDQLVNAVKSGDHDKVEELLTLTNDYVNIKSEDNETLLIIACESNDLPMARLLLDHNADIDGRGIKERTPLMVAATNGNKDLLELLIDRKASLDLQCYIYEKKCSGYHCPVDIEYFQHLSNPKLNDSGATALMFAGYEGHLGCAKVLLKANASVTILNSLNRTVIAMLASKKINQNEIAAFILDHYCHQLTRGSNEVNAIHDHEFQITILHFAVILGKFNATKILLNLGALPDVGDAIELTPLHYAAENEDAEIIKLLMEFGASPFTWSTAPYGILPLRTPILMTENLEIQNIIVEQVTNQFISNHEIDIEQDLGDFGSTLHYASRFGKIEIVQTLLSLGASNLAKNKFGMLPIHWAAYFGYLEVAKELLKHNKPMIINAQDNEGYTPLHYAASYGYLDVVELLVENEASTDIKDYYGNDPHDLAVAFGYIEVAQFLQIN